ncbi:hypothetical protein K2X33_16735 [bacterium]|nr:hypothetical protein [bacterium]
MHLWGALFFVLSFALVGCGKPEPTHAFDLPRFQVPPLESQRIEMLRRFPLVNAQEEESAPMDPVSGRAPFGALVHMPASGKGGFCSVAHVTRGFVTANAHCIDEDKDAGNYFVVFYNRRNWKRYERVLSFAYVGNRESLDVAVLKISDDAASSWDTVDGDNIPAERDLENSDAIMHKVIAWTFNPFEKNHPELFERYKGPGMRFYPKHCNAARKPPELFGVGLNNGKPGKTHIRSPREDVKGMHWFIDDCDGRPVKGNSGSLVTDANDIRKMLGVFHWTVEADEKDQEKFNHFEYKSLDGHEQVLSWEDMSKRVFYGVGSDFTFLFSQAGKVF